MKTLTYNVNLTGLKVLKTDKEQNRFFGDGHPSFLIPDFSSFSEDIWLSFMSYLEKKNGAIYDQDGGEVESNSIVDTSTGLTKCVYSAYGISFSEDEYPSDYTVEIEGYVIDENNRVQFSDLYFLATKVTIL